MRESKWQFRQPLWWSALPLVPDHLTTPPSIHRAAKQWSLEFRTFLKFRAEQPLEETLAEVLSDRAVRLDTSALRLSIEGLIALDARIAAWSDLEGKRKLIDPGNTLSGRSLPEVSDEALQRGMNEVQIFTSHVYAPLFRVFASVTYLYPLSVTFFGALRARNILIRAQFRTTDRMPVDASDAGIFGQSSTTSLTLDRLLPVWYHAKSPAFHEEIKVRLPVPLPPAAHVLFTFYHVRFSGKDDGNEEMNDEEKLDFVEVGASSTLDLGNRTRLVGFAFLPLWDSERRQLIAGELSLPIARDCPENYLTSPKVHWIEKGKKLFALRAKSISSIQTPPETVGQILTLSVSEGQETAWMAALEVLEGLSPKNVLRYLFQLLDKLLSSLDESGEKSRLRSILLNCLIVLLQSSLQRSDTDTLTAESEDPLGSFYSQKYALITEYISLRFTFRNAEVLCGTTAEWLQNQALTFATASSLEFILAMIRQAIAHGGSVKSATVLRLGTRLVVLCKSNSTSPVTNLPEIAGRWIRDCAAAWDRGITQGLVALFWEQLEPLGRWKFFRPVACADALLFVNAIPESVLFESGKNVASLLQLIEVHAPMLWRACTEAIALFTHPKAPGKQTRDLQLQAILALLSICRRPHCSIHAHASLAALVFPFLYQLMSTGMQGMSEEAVPHVMILCAYVLRWLPAPFQEIWLGNEAPARLVVLLEVLLHGCGLFNPAEPPLGSLVPILSSGSSELTVAWRKSCREFALTTLEVVAMMQRVFQHQLGGSALIDAEVAGAFSIFAEHIRELMAAIFARLIENEPLEKLCTPLTLSLKSFLNAFGRSLLQHDLVSLKKILTPLMERMGGNMDILRSQSTALVYLCLRLNFQTTGNIERVGEIILSAAAQAYFDKDVAALLLRSLATLPRYCGYDAVTSEVSLTRDHAVFVEEVGELMLALIRMASDAQSIRRAHSSRDFDVLAEISLQLTVQRGQYFGTRLTWVRRLALALHEGSFHHAEGLAYVTEAILLCLVHSPHDSAGVLTRVIHLCQPLTLLLHENLTQYFALTQSGMVPANSSSWHAARESMLSLFRQAADCFDLSQNEFARCIVLRSLLALHEASWDFTQTSQSYENVQRSYLRLASYKFQFPAAYALLSWCETAETALWIYIEEGAALGNDDLSARVTARFQRSLSVAPSSVALPPGDVQVRRVRPLLHCTQLPAYVTTLGTSVSFGTFYWDELLEKGIRGIRRHVLHLGEGHFPALLTRQPIVREEELNLSLSQAASSTWQLVSELLVALISMYESGAPKDWLLFVLEGVLLQPQRIAHFLQQDYQPYTSHYEQLLSVDEGMGLNTVCMERMLELHRNVGDAFSRIAAHPTLAEAFHACSTQVSRWVPPQLSRIMTKNDGHIAAKLVQVVQPQPQRPGQSGEGEMMHGPFEMEGESPMLIVPSPAPQDVAMDEGNVDSAGTSGFRKMPERAQSMDSQRFAHKELKKVKSSKSMKGKVFSKKRGELLLDDEPESL
jgi:hypothetical protein